ncbi:DUF1783-domain-containing protein [Violaceomyces palustris]|uniref:DUF1783-domain-containing protein n=1 Tax=Violaceomyces palustris TaxID=1673888 RepID=A0ACD0NXH8_9BASI|nr:DUF1783-domain-containing protein [Violaceomyces palustris]
MFAAKGMIVQGVGRGVGKSGQVGARCTLFTHSTVERSSASASWRTFNNVPLSPSFPIRARRDLQERRYSNDPTRLGARYRPELPKVPVHHEIERKESKKKGSKSLTPRDPFSLSFTSPSTLLDPFTCRCATTDGKNRKPILLLAALIAIGSWSTFASFATNKERLSSSVFRSVLIQLKDSEEVKRTLGDPVMLVPSTFGDPWVSGSVNMMQGKVDISFKIQGPKDTGTAYFTSIRREQNKSFEVLRFLLVTDSGENVSLLSQVGRTHDSDGEMGSP